MAAKAWSLFEPLAARGVARPPVPSSTAASLPDAPGTYLPKSAELPEWARVWDGIFAGKGTNTWTRQDWRHVPAYAQRWELTRRLAYRLAPVRHRLEVGWSKRPLVKEIHANLMLPWLARTQPVQVVYVLRHPCAVVSSRVRLGWPSSLDGVIGQPLLLQDWLSSFVSVIERAEDPIERMAVLWCVENLVPLRCWQPDWVLACYEAMAESPLLEFEQLCCSLDLPLSCAAVRTALARYSSASPKKSVPAEWHAGLGEIDGQRVLDVCSAFGLDFYGRAVMPLRAPFNARQYHGVNVV